MWQRSRLLRGDGELHDGAFDEGDFGADDFRKAGYVETEDCAMDVSICMLRYSKGQGICLSVAIDGDNPADAFVDSWDSSCPKNP